MSDCDIQRLTLVQANKTRVQQKSLDQLKARANKREKYLDLDKMKLKPVYDTLPCNSGDKMKIQNVSCVEREGPWHTSYQDAKKHWLIEDVDGDMKNHAKVW